MTCARQSSRTGTQSGTDNTILTLTEISLTRDGAKPPTVLFLGCTRCLNLSSFVELHFYNFVLIHGGVLMYVATFVCSKIMETSGSHELFEFYSVHYLMLLCEWACSFL